MSPFDVMLGTVMEFENLYHLLNTSACNLGYTDPVEHRGRTTQHISNIITASFRSAGRKASAMICCKLNFLFQCSGWQNSDLEKKR